MKVISELICEGVEEYLSIARDCQTQVVRPEPRLYNRPTQWPGITDSLTTDPHSTPSHLTRASLRGKLTRRRDNLESSTEELTVQQRDATGKNGDRKTGGSDNSSELLYHDKAARVEQIMQSGGEGDESSIGRKGTSASLSCLIILALVVEGGP